MTTIALLDARIAEIIHTVTSGRKVEDSTVELKSRWLSLPKMARRIAGHANDMHGEPILWIIGIDEDAFQVTGCDEIEMADWERQFYAEFELNNGPQIILHRRYKHENVQVFGILFETNAAPYLIHVRPKEREGVMPTFEVPFRMGSAVHTAKRGHLLRLLKPTAALPYVEFIRVRADGSFKTRLKLSAVIYIACLDDKRIIIPKHRCAIGFRVDQDEEYVNARYLEVEPWHEATKEDELGRTVTPPQVVIDPGTRLTISGDVQGDVSQLGGSEIFVRTSLFVLPAERTLTFTYRLIPADSSLTWSAVSGRL